MKDYINDAVENMIKEYDKIKCVLTISYCDGANIEQYNNAIRNGRKLGEITGENFEPASCDDNILILVNSSKNEIDNYIAKLHNDYETNKSDYTEPEIKLFFNDKELTKNEMKPFREYSKEAHKFLKNN